ncbi:transmembrane protein [Thalictrum thalictroides]|uniref:Transmembrane protein n=1 Tax=Thalictrum thalictroides TaxID=46969 RepID=A0A7J6UT71_THATH|nr:transmembrane protein [Thalictrum thalictroides]
MGAITTSVIAIAALVLGWITMEMACKPCLDKGREAIDRSLDPNYDPDDENNSIQSPLNPNPDSSPDGINENVPATAAKIV